MSGVTHKDGFGIDVGGIYKSKTGVRKGGFVKGTDPECAKYANAENACGMGGYRGELLSGTGKMTYVGNSNSKSMAY